VPERIKLLASQVKSWLDLGEIENARSSLNDLLHNSLGVHSRDNQMNSWISWAQHANYEDPSGASTRLQLLVSGLPDLKDKEVLSDAAGDLLKAAWKWNSGSAISLFEWMLQHELIGFTRGLQNLLEQAIESGNAAAGVGVLLFEEILLPLMRTTEAKFAQEVVKTMVKDGSRKGDQDLSRLIDRILVASLGSNRRPWISAIRQTTEKAGLPWDRIVHIEDQAILDQLLQSSEVDSPPAPPAETDWRREEAELREQLHSLEALEIFLSAQSASSFLQWENILGKLLKELEPAAARPAG
jgi:hypothetical protein